MIGFLSVKVSATDSTPRRHWQGWSSLTSSVGFSKTERVEVSCQQSPLLNPAETTTTWKKLVVEAEWQIHGPVSLEEERCELSSYVSTPSPAVRPAADPEMTVAWSWGHRSKGSVVSLNGCWLTPEELPANPPCSFCIQQLNFYCGHVFARRGCCEWRKKLLLKKQHFHAAPLRKPVWHRAPAGWFLKQSTAIAANASLAWLHRGTESTVRKSR